MSGRALTTMRDRVINRIANQGRFDYCYTRGDQNAKTYASYADWLQTECSDDDLIDAFVRVIQATTEANED